MATRSMTRDLLLVSIAVQQRVQQLGRKRAVSGDDARGRTCGNREVHARVARFRKPPVGSSSLPVGSVENLSTFARSHDDAATRPPFRKGVIGGRLTS
jgi:hypothetical protein